MAKRNHEHRESILPTLRATGLLLALFGFALVVLVAAEPDRRRAEADATDNVFQSNGLTAGDCDETEWHWVINQLDGRTAPAHIHVYFNTGTITVPLDMVSGGVAHYSLPAASVPSGSFLVAPGASATLENASTWLGNFNLSHRPCGTPTPTVTLTVTNTPTNTPVTNTPTNTPVTNTPTNTPVTNTPTNTPVTNTPTNTPVTNTPTNTPVTNTPTNTPVTNTPTNTPTNTVPGVTGSTSTPAPTATVPGVVAAEVITPVSPTEQALAASPTPAQPLTSEALGAQATPPTTAAQPQVQGTITLPSTGSGGMSSQTSHAAWPIGVVMMLIGGALILAPQVWTKIR